MIFIENSAGAGQNIENLFVKNDEVVNRKVKEGYYDLKNGNCGIKKRNEGVNDNNIILNKENFSNNKGESCCYYLPNKNAFSISSNQFNILIILFKYIEL